MVLRAVATMKQAKRFALSHTVTDLLETLIADPMIDPILGPHASAADIANRSTDREGIDLGDITATRRHDLDRLQTLCQQHFRPVTDPWVATLQFNILPKPLKRLTRPDDLLNFEF